MRTIACALVGLLSMAPSWAAPAAPPAQPVRINGYSDEAMEPFLSRDGRFLFFNTRNDTGANTNIHFAEWNGTEFVYRSALQGTISYDLDATPTMSADGRFCFVSPRDYRRSLLSVYCGAFDGKRVIAAEPQKMLPGERMGRLIFDVELFADGKTMIFAEGTFSGSEVPDEADLYLATLGSRGFIRHPNGAKTFANVNTGDLEFAPAISADGLVLYFTRIDSFPFSKAKIYRAERSSTDQPFAKPVRLEGLDGFVEGPTIAADGTLYFHKRIKGRYEIWRVAR